MQQNRFEEHPWRTGILLILASTIFLILTAELVARLFLDNAAPRFIAPQLLQQNRFGESFGLAANQQGEVGGVTVQTDRNGFRYDPNGPEFDSKLPTAAFLGDSVVFGNGVRSGRIFADLVAGENRGQRNIINISAPGWGIDHHIDVLDHYLLPNAEALNVEKVILVYSLNDVVNISGAELARVEEKSSKDLGFTTKLRNNLKSVQVFRSINQFTRRYSRLYLVFKKYVLDTPKVWFENDLVIYQSIEPGELEDKLRMVNARLEAKGIEFLVVIIPYEYQLRVATEDVFKPQNMVEDMLSAMNVEFHDLRDPMLSHMREAEESSGYFFLYADAMHLSPQGHAFVAGEILERAFGARGE
jgi:hypothetical protein